MLMDFNKELDFSSVLLKDGSIKVNGSKVK
jgi:hypothetical protein